MSVQFEEIERLPSMQEIEEFEKVNRVKLHPDFRNFILKYNGVEMEPNMFAAANDVEGSVRSFLPLETMAEARSNIEDEIPKSFWPIAEDDCGNYILMDMKSGFTYFMDHEMDEDEAIAKVADSLDALLEMLVSTRDM